MAPEKILIIGGQGLLGSWISKGLLEDGIDFVLFDRKPENSLLSQVIEPDVLPSIQRLFGNPSQPERVARIVQDQRITRLIHLAGAGEEPGGGGQKQEKRPGAGDIEGAFEAVRASGGNVSMIVYFSNSSEREEVARSYYRQHRIPSVGLRPVEVYGVGRELGLMSSLTRAIKAAVLSRSFTIPFRGTGALSYVEDVARTFIAAVLSDVQEALAFEPRTQDIPVKTFIQKLEEAIPGSSLRIEALGEEIQSGVLLEESTLEDLPGSEAIQRTPLEDGIRRTAELFRLLADDGRLRDV